MRKISLYIIIFISILNGKNLFAQIEVEGTINFTNTEDSLRNIYNISNSDSLHEATRTNEYLFQKYFSDEVSINGNLLEINTSFEFPNYATGLNLIVNIPTVLDSINTPIYLKINQQSPVLIKTIFQDTVSNLEMVTGNHLVLMYDGLSFIIINHQTYPCPPGYKQMNDKYCIQTTRNTKKSFWQATKICNDKGYHLCTYQEWYYACINNTGMSNMPQNFEWVHSTSNHNVHALKIGEASSCTNADSETTSSTGLPMYYRCCYHLR